MATRRARSSEADELLKTIEAAHAAGLEAERWPDALGSVARLFGAVGSTLEIFSKRPMRLKELRIFGIPDSAETPYVEYYSQHNPRAAYAMRNLSQRILFDYRMIDERRMDRDPYYADYLAPNDLRYFMTGQIVDTPDLHGVISVQRSGRQGHVEKRDLALMQRLLPHLQQAYDVSLRLRRAGDTQDLFEGALDWLADGAALVDADGAVLYANVALQALVRRNDGIRFAKRTLEFVEADAAGRFALAMAGVGRLRYGDILSAGASDFIVPRPAGAPPYLVAVRPVIQADRTARSRRRVAAIVFVRDPLRAGATEAQALQDIFRLTEAEATVALALQAGTSLVEYARRQRLSINTVYTHLRRIKEKTHCRRQAELIRRLNDVGLPLRKE